MRRPVIGSLLAALVLTSATAQAQTPPHAWLFGEWTGGLFPAPSVVTAAQCLAQPSVIFTRDVVMTSSLLVTTYSQHPVQTVRVTANGAEIRFAAPPPTAGTDPLGLTGAPAQEPPGLGCANPAALSIVRKNENEIMFENCPEFPNPLVRCPSK